MASARIRNGVRMADSQYWLANERHHRRRRRRARTATRDAVLPDRKDLLVLGVGGLELACFAIDHGSPDPLDALLAEQPLGPHQQEGERQHVREPGLDAAADVRPEIDLGELFRRADDEAADDRAGDRLEAAQDQHRQRLQGDEGQRELHAVARAPHEPRDQRDEAGHRPHDRPDLPQRDADRERRLVVVGHRAQRAADARRLEEHRQRGDQHARPRPPRTRRTG